jgi:hypothetical protein
VRRAVSPMTPGWVRATIEEFDALGWHRTGSPGDTAATRWLIEQVSSLGIPAEPASFSFPMVAVEHAQISTGDIVIDGHPQFDAGFIVPDSVRAPLALTGEYAQGRIVVIDVERDTGLRSANLDTMLVLQPHFAIISSSASPMRETCSGLVSATPARQR